MHLEFDAVLCYHCYEIGPGTPVQDTLHVTTFTGPLGDFTRGDGLVR